MYYAILFSAVTMFGFMFLFNQQYSALRGSSLRAAFSFMLGGYSAGLLVLLAVNGFKIEFAPFSLVMALWSVVNLLLYNICSIRALGKINLSLFSVFAMLGGMTLPFVFGIVYFNEPMTLGKGVCFALIALSLVFTVNKGTGKTGGIYYVGVFMFNGMSGVISKFYADATWRKTSEAGYSILISLIVIAVSGTVLLCTKKPHFEKNIKAFGCAAANGVLCNVGNFLMLIALRKLPASAQYPIITGGTMIVSTVIAAFSKNKPAKKEYIAVVISFVGILMLVLLDR